MVLCSRCNQPALFTVTLFRPRAVMKQNSIVINITPLLRHILGENLKAAVLGVTHRPRHEPADRCDVTVTEDGSRERRAEHGRPTMCISFIGAS